MTIFESHPVEHSCWKSMIQRCKNPNNPGFRDYGGRGITVCLRWASFANFLEDMGTKPDPTFSIDRIDNDGNYKPNNCRWATRSEQASNKRKRIVLCTPVSLTNVRTVSTILMAKTKRTLKSESLRAISRGSGVDVAALSRWLAGARDLSGPSIDALAAYLDLSLTEKVK